ncbi:hypothetical protein CBR_g57836 [Chara braunii]|uniref:Uncharacterized protein n=1 Tax=Chara braunii TaxID=69332 RepID=A0A388K8H6_CHABU|nr:hypothetical protein CBR_g57836 [Chara braunii]|eukprot:GBG66233.1 hypothetical protein CBR_g57836 [Chara braunii]
MFSLLFGLWKYMFSKSEFHVLILGIDKAGKTTLLEKVKAIFTEHGLPPDRIVPTVGLNIGNVEAYKAKLIFWDLGGQLGLRTIWDKYYEDAHAVLYVIDATNNGRFDDSKNALDRVLRNDDLAGAPVLIVANKQDLSGAFSAEELAKRLGIKEVHDRPCAVKAISAYDGTGVREGVHWLVEAMRHSQRSELLRQRVDAAAVF